MKTTTSLLLAAAVALAAAGCDKKVDPREQPGFIDTSDPGKVAGTMTAVPKTPKGGPGGVGGVGGVGTGPAPSKTKP